MAAGDTIDGGEDLVRALWTPLFDRKLNRATTAAFRDKRGVSVSRTAVWSFQEIVDHYKHQFPNLEAVCTISAKTVYDEVKPSEDFEVEITEDPEQGSEQRLPNPAHALIQGYRKAKVATKDRPAMPREKAQLSEGIARRLQVKGVTAMV